MRKEMMVSQAFYKFVKKSDRRTDRRTLEDASRIKNYDTTGSKILYIWKMKIIFL